MKVTLFFAALCFFSAALARAEGDVQAPAAKAPVETIEVAPESSSGLFERVREAHTRAVQKGSIGGGVRS